jgi:DNA-directed RNA polymerase specialized sigma24 family protein
VGPDADVPDRIETLRTLLEETAERLADDPRDEKYHRAVHRTYVQPAPTQEKAAEQLGVPFSTFRRHLNKGLERVADILWEREVGVSA